MLGLKEAGGAVPVLKSGSCLLWGAHLLDRAIAADLAPHLADAAPCVLRQLRQLLRANLHGQVRVSATLVTILFSSELIGCRPVTSQPLKDATC